MYDFAAAWLDDILLIKVLASVFPWWLYISPEVLWWLAIGSQNSQQDWVQLWFIVCSLSFDCFAATSAPLCCTSHMWLSLDPQWYIYVSLSNMCPAHISLMVHVSLKILSVTYVSIVWRCPPHCIKYKGLVCFVSSYFNFWETTKKMAAMEVLCLKNSTLLTVQI